MGLPCSHQLRKYLINTGSDILTVQKELFDLWRLIPQPTRVVDEAIVRHQEPQIRTHRLARSQRVMASHARNTGSFGTQRAATRAELMVSDTPAPPPILGEGSSQMQTALANEYHDVSLAQIARRSGIPPSTKRSRLENTFLPSGTPSCNCKKGCATGVCSYRKRGNPCTDYCYNGRSSCDNIRNGKSTEQITTPAVPVVDASTNDLLVLAREECQQQARYVEVAGNRIHEHQSIIRAVNHRRASLNQHNQPPWRAVDTTEGDEVIEI